MMMDFTVCVHANTSLQAAEASDAARLSSLFVVRVDPKVHFVSNDTCESDRRR
jgi:hypothetical protein